MKEKELRQYADCSMCGNKIGATGIPLFWRVTVERFGIDLKATQRQTGLAMLLGNNGVLAQVMGPDEEMTMPITTTAISRVASKTPTTAIRCGLTISASRRSTGARSAARSTRPREGNHGGDANARAGVYRDTWSGDQGSPRKAGKTLMSDKSAIEWTEATWNCITGCTKVSQGCKHCYAEREWARIAAPRDRCKPNRYTGRAFTDVACHEDLLDRPLRWKRPRRIFVNSMSDLFHESVPDNFIDEVFAVMALAGRHIFQVLTKRPERMLEYFTNKYRWVLIEGAAQAIEQERTGADPSLWLAVHGPLKNVWIGVSCEDQATADERIPLLLQTPAAVRWVSAEPLLGPIDFTDLTVQLPDGVAQWNALHCDTEPGDCAPYGDAVLDWVVAGGESGPQARPMHPDWVRAIRDQCQAAGVPFFFKQWGEWAPNCFCGAFASDPCRSTKRPEPGKLGAMFRCGKKSAGRTLDGRTWDEYPA